MRTSLRAAVLSSLVPLSSYAQTTGMTPAFTTIFSEAKVAYSSGALTYTSYADPVSSMVEQVFGLTVSWDRDKNLKSYARGTSVDIGLTIKNSGNGRDAFFVSYAGNARNWLYDPNLPVYDDKGQYPLGTATWLEPNEAVSLRLRLKVPYDRPPLDVQGLDGFYGALAAHSVGGTHIASEREEGSRTWWVQDRVLGREDLWSEQGWDGFTNRAFWASTVSAMGADRSGWYLAMSDNTIQVFRPSGEWDNRSVETRLVGSPAFSERSLAWRTVDGKLLAASTADLTANDVFSPPGGYTVVGDPCALPGGFAVVLSDQSMRQVPVTGSWGAGVALPAQATTPPLLHDGLVYVGLASGEVVCMDVAMRIRWVSQLWRGPIRYLVPTEGRLLGFASTTNRVGILDLDSRLPMWSQRLDSAVRGLCCTDKGAYALGADRKVYGFSLITGWGLMGFPTRPMTGESSDLAPGLVAVARSANAPAYLWATSRAPIDNSNTSDASLLAFCGDLGINLYGIGRRPETAQEVVDAVSAPMLLPFDDETLIGVAINGTFHPNGGNKSWAYLWRPNFAR